MSASTIKIPITILGAGPAGLGVAYFAKKRGIPFRLFESGESIGGNCATNLYSNSAYGEFLYDTGAHRLHDRDPEITAELRAVLGSDLQEVNAPNLIYESGRFIDFPISPLSLLGHLGLFDFISSAFDTCVSRLSAADLNGSFESYARHKYGAQIAERFLLNYSEKLWGIPCSSLSAAVAGTRLKGLSLRAFLFETFVGDKRKAAHLEGAHFYYPKGGFGTITTRLADLAGRESIHLNSRVTGVLTENNRIVAIQVNGKERINTERVVNTLPVNLLLRMIDPVPPTKILALSDSLKFRSLVLVALFLDRESVSNAATIYFPENRFPFSRVYEPRNRSRDMSPPGMTSLVIEIPCSVGDSSWIQTDSELVTLLTAELVKIGWIKPSQVIGSAVKRVPFAYPVLEVGIEQKVQQILNFLGEFRNLYSTGRNGRFAYTWLHDMLRWGKEIVSELERR